MRKVSKINRVGVRAYEPAGFVDYALDDPDAPGHAVRVEITHGEGEDATVETVLRVSWAEKPKAFVLGGIVESDAKRKPRREGSLSVPGWVLPSIAERAHLTDAESAAWIAQYPPVGAPPVPANAQQVALLQSASRKIIDSLMGATVYVEGGDAKGKSAGVLAY